MNSEVKNNRNEPTVYVLELADGKFYVGKSNDVQRRYDEHVRGAASEWTKIHKAVGIVETRENASEDTVVLEYMKMKGIENVRGGAFSQIDISAHVPTIESLIRSRDDSCFKCGKSGHFAADCEVVTAVSSWLSTHMAAVKQKIHAKIMRAMQEHFTEELQQKTGFGTAAGKIVYAAVSEIFEATLAEVKQKDHHYKNAACDAVLLELVEKMAATKAKKLFGATTSSTHTSVATLDVAAPNSSEAATTATAATAATAAAPESTAAPTQVRPRYDANCSRCGRNNHVAEKCFAKTRIDGSQI